MVDSKGNERLPTRGSDAEPVILHDIPCFNKTPSNELDDSLQSSICSLVEATES